jgi:hypothetical protein
MGELAGEWDNTPESQIAKDKEIEIPDGKIEIPDMDGHFADGINKDQLPIFNVSHDEFYQNMTNGRQRIRFKTGSDAQKFMQNGKYNKPFWIRDPEGYVRKVK